MLAHGEEEGIARAELLAGQAGTSIRTVPGVLHLAPVASVFAANSSSGGPNRYDPQVPFSANSRAICNRGGWLVKFARTLNGPHSRRHTSVRQPSMLRDCPQ